MSQPPAIHPAAWPKVELHRHLEGTVRPATAWHWAQRSPTLRHLRRDQLARALTYDGQRDFAHFLQKFVTLRQLYYHPDAVRQVAREAVEDAASENIRYFEVRFSPDHFARQAGWDPLEAAGWVVEEARAAGERHGVVVRFLCTIGRSYDGPTAQRIVEIVLALRAHGVVGVDLAGDELQHPAPPFLKLLERAAQEGLGVTIHAGEVGPPAAVWAAIQELHAARIGHGIQSIHDPALLDALRARDILLEVCPTSNLHTGAVPDAASHPLAALLRAGVPLALGADDPAISRITLNDEFRFAREQAGLSDAEIAGTVLAGARHAFLPAAERATLLTRLQAELAPLLGELPPAS